MKETILRDGEIAFLVGGVEIIMNDNTLLGLLEKFGLVEKVGNATTEAKPKTDAGSDAKPNIGANLSVTVATMVANNLKSKSTPVYPISKQTNVPADGASVCGRTMPVIAFLYDKSKVDESGNRYDGFVARYKYFESAQEAEQYFDMAKGRVSAIARTWNEILGKSWKDSNPVADKSRFKGYYGFWNEIPYSFTAETPHGTMAFIYVSDIPHKGLKKTFVV